MSDTFGELREALNAPTIDVDAAEDALEALAQEHGHDHPQVMGAKEMARRAYAGILRRVTDQDPIVGYIGYINGPVKKGAEHVPVEGADGLGFPRMLRSLGDGIWLVAMRRSGAVTFIKARQEVGE